MKGKGFPEMWINMVMQTVEDGKICVNVNGERSKGISHIQYADDTVILLDGSDKSVVNLKLILYCFEWLSGLKINFQKSEVYAFGVDQAEKERMANMLNCVIGTFPMKYLGIPVSDSHLSASSFMQIFEKMKRRLDPWKGKHLSSGLILTNSCLSSLPMYMMGFYLLLGGVHRAMDSIRSKFFWEGAEGSGKYHMAKWSVVIIPKDRGGLGVVDTKLMKNGRRRVGINYYELSTCMKIIFSSLNTKVPLSFGKAFTKSSICLIGGLFTKLGMVKESSSEKMLYNICEDKEVLVSDCWDGQEWNIGFRRTLSSVDLNLWGELISDLQGVRLGEGRDEVLWGLDKSHHFSTKSLYRFRTDGGVSNRTTGIIWKSKIPMKIKVFLWQLSKGKLQAASVLKKKGWKGSVFCALCGEVETINHIFFHCPLARFAWCNLREAFGWE
ncbi:LOW QUALITY PROTEIN: hypothetical protein U9M48_030040, partial [Paspalum notatum var. saurae]